MQLVVKHLKCSEIELYPINSLEVGSNPVGCQTLLVLRNRTVACI